MTASLLLRSARKLITDRHNWIGGTGRQELTMMAQDAKGREIDPRDDAARRWSLDGALLRCADLATKDGQGDYHQAVQHLRSMRKGKSLADINDGKSHGEIMDLLEIAERALAIVSRSAA